MGIFDNIKVKRLEERNQKIFQDVLPKADDKSQEALNVAIGAIGACCATIPEKMLILKSHSSILDSAYALVDMSMALMCLSLHTRYLLPEFNDVCECETRCCNSVAENDMKQVAELFKSGIHAMPKHEKIDDYFEEQLTSIMGDGMKEKYQDLRGVFSRFLFDYKDVLAPLRENGDMRLFTDKLLDIILADVKAEKFHVFFREPVGKAPIAEKMPLIEFVTSVIGEFLPRDKIIKQQCATVYWK